MAFGDTTKGKDVGGSPTTIREAIGERLKDIAGNVEDQIINVFVDREVDRRAKAVVNVIDQTIKMEQDLRKLKPDVVTYSDNGDVATSSWTKAKLDEKKKLEERIQKFANAVNKAIDKDDYSDVFNLSAGKTEASD